MNEQELAFKRSTVIESSLAVKLKKIEKLSESVRQITVALFSNITNIQTNSIRPVSIYIFCIQINLFFFKL